MGKNIKNENALILDQEKMEAFKGSRILVVGLARTGISAIKFLSEMGCRVTVTESRTKAALAEALQGIKDREVEWEFGGHTEKSFLNNDWIVVSPGVPMNIPPLVMARERGIPILSDVELAYRITQVPMIAVTGTNGKTTTTTLLGEILKKGGRSVFVGGNIGVPILDAFMHNQAYELLVVEVSSFQLEGITTFAPHISIILNLTPDHLDRYSNLSEYQEAKAKIVDAQTEKDYTILNAQDPWVSSLSERTRGGIYYFDTRQPVSQGIDIMNGAMILHDQGQWVNLGLIEDMGLKGIHNWENVMAASLASYLVDISDNSIREVVKSFKGLPHRIEKVRDVGGIQFINDSKGTNVGAVIKALESFEAPIILIAGGQDKGSDFSSLTDLVKEKTTALFLIGEATEKIAKALEGYTSIIKASDLKSAVLGAYRMAKPGHSILLSPGCASFDMFKDYKDRGEQFRKIVEEL